MHVHDFEHAQGPAPRPAVNRDRSPASVAGVQAMLALQRLAGNQSVNAMLEENRPSPVSDSGGGSPAVQRQSPEEEESEEALPVAAAAPAVDVDREEEQEG